ncbi:hypothetical protein [Geobacter sp. SVR]|uniref:hypothetical protein n=1 Tax=Geobacter sp. SVR TaxID=2495594 RepID=UPI00143EFA6C|nr:hypothetical protein [Geobacter sp. SVR]BCS53011.1 hypothetical protein GSVR_13190 [Geobacter sp. SVR]GCF84396.1 hypothetical protein GSbR_09960 [Geobacter sp. SVR]
MQISRSKALLCLLILLTVLPTGCSTGKPAPSREQPPLLSHDELIRPYVQLGHIQVTREVYGILDYEVKPDIREWGLDALRAEAEKMGADAVIESEVTGTTTTYLILPSTEYRATGTAIKFK